MTSPDLQQEWRDFCVSLEAQSEEGPQADQLLRDAEAGFMAFVMPARALVPRKEGSHV